MITSASRWRGCCAAAQRAATPLPTTSSFVNAAIAALPPRFRRRLMITCDGAGASHDLVKRLDKLAARPRAPADLLRRVGAGRAGEDRAAAGPGHRRGKSPSTRRGEVRERRAGGACGNGQCGHRACWIEEAHVSELTGLLRQGPAGDQLKGWPKTMRVFARRERPHPGRAAHPVRSRRRLALLPVGDEPARRHQGLAAGSAPTSTQATGCRHASKTSSAPGRTPASAISRPLISRLNTAWLTASMIACILLAWLQHLALDGKLAKAEPKTLRYRVLHAAARLVRGGRRTTPQDTRPPGRGPTAITTAWRRIGALPHAP